MNGKMIEIETGDGAAMAAYLALPASGSGAGLVLLQEIFGVNQSLRETADLPSGAFLSTVLDLAKWDAVLYTDRVLTESSRRQMWTPATLNDGSTYPYGFGWQLGDDPDRMIVHHAGGMPGFRADFARFVDDALTVILLANLDDMDPWAILWGVAAIHRQERE